MDSTPNVADIEFADDLHLYLSLLQNAPVSLNYTRNNYFVQFLFIVICIAMPVKCNSEQMIQYTPVRPSMI